MRNQNVRRQDATLSIRLWASEKQEIVTASKTTGVRLTVFIRDALLKAAKLALKKKK